MSARPRVAIIDSTINTYVASAEIEEKMLADSAEVVLLRVPTSAALSEANLNELTGVISWHSIPLGASEIGRLSRCRLIVRAAVGFDNIDVGEAARRGMPVCNVPDYGTEEVADHAIALLLALARGLLTVDSAAKQGRWDWRLAGRPSRLRGKTLGIVGFGRIGTAVARRALPFGMNVVFFDPYVSSGTEKAHGVSRVHSLNDLVDRAEIISIHVPLTPQTHHLFGREQFSRMCGGKTLINTARGEVVDQEAMLAALREGRLGMAGLDVLECEPQVPCELAERGDVLLSSHSAFFSEESLLELREKAAATMKEALVSGMVRNSVNGVAMLR